MLKSASEWLTCDIPPDAQESTSVSLSPPAPGSHLTVGVRRWLSPSGVPVAGAARGSRSARDPWAVEAAENLPSAAGAWCSGAVDRRLGTWRQRLSRLCQVYCRERARVARLIAVRKGKETRGTRTSERLGSADEHAAAARCASQAMAGEEGAEAAAC